MELLGRDKYERQLEGELAAILSRQDELDAIISQVRGSLETGAVWVIQAAFTNWTEFVSDQYQDVTAQLIAKKENDKKRRRKLLLAFLLSLGARELVAQWAISAADRAAIEIVQSTQRGIARARWLASVAMFDERMRALVAGGSADDVYTLVLQSKAARLFDRARAGRIAATEVTRWVSLGELLAQRMVEQASGIRFVRLWYTKDDELVCPICGPLHGVREELWVAIYPLGPPAHPECRCWETYKLVEQEGVLAA